MSGAPHPDLAPRRGLVRSCAALAAVAALGLGPAACGTGGGDGGRSGDGRSNGDASLTAEQRRRADQLVSVFENGTTRIQYAYAENLHDGRGVTAGRAGFTTDDGDALEVVRAYTEQVPDNPLARFLPALERHADGGGNGNGNGDAAEGGEEEAGGSGDPGDSAAVPDDAYIVAWKRAAADPAFREVQDAQVDARYFDPALRAARKAGLSSPLALAELYDASIQHGNGTDGDSLPALVKRTTAKVGTPAEAGEKKWLDAFFDVRVHDLRHPVNTGTAKEWRASVDRVEAVRRIAANGNDDLDGPFTVTAFGSAHTIK
ncbi:chitosanase [Streptomyces sp. NPDC047123]|uniref:chitosanase n=1 Tax=Streptomyces sp. NPDC047123 TaxID=3155622 RepID=UPI0033C1322E